MATAIYGFETVQGSDLSNFDDLINGVTQSIEDHLPQRYVASITALAALTGAAHPDGQLAVLTADNSGLRAGAIFVRKESAWHFAVGTVQTIATFVSALGANVKTLPGATFHEESSATSRIFTTTTGTSATLIGGQAWTAITHADGYVHYGIQAPLSYRLVPGGAMLRGSIRHSGGLAIAPASTIGNVPSGARPSYATRAVVNGEGNAIGLFEIGTNGNIGLYATANRTSSYYVFDGVFLPIT